MMMMMMRIPKVIRVKFLLTMLIHTCNVVKVVSNERQIFLTSTEICLSISEENHLQAPVRKICKLAIIGLVTSFCHKPPCCCDSVQETQCSSFNVSHTRSNIHKAANNSRSSDSCVLKFGV